MTDALANTANIPMITKTKRRLSQIEAAALASDTGNYSEYDTHDLIRVQQYFAHLVALLAEEIRNRYDRGIL